MASTVADLIVATLRASGVTGQLAVCAASCGPGNLHLINGWELVELAKSNLRDLEVE